MESLFVVDLAGPRPCPSLKARTVVKKFELPKAWHVGCWVAFYASKHCWISSFGCRPGLVWLYHFQQLWFHWFAHRRHRHLHHRCRNNNGCFYQLCYSENPVWRRNWRRQTPRGQKKRKERKHHSTHRWPVSSRVRYINALKYVQNDKTPLLLA